MGMTLRYPYEVRDEKDYFDDIPGERVTKDMLDLATHIIKTKTGHFHPEKFEDQYEDALKDLLRKKDKGEKIEMPPEREHGNVINLMDALRRSVKAEQAQPTKGKKAVKRAAGQKEMLFPIEGKRTAREEAKKPARASGRQKKAG